MLYWYPVSKKVLRPVKTLQDYLKKEKRIKNIILSPEVRSKAKISNDDIFVNYGTSTLENRFVSLEHRIINKPDCVKNAVDKLKAFDIFVQHNIPIPEITKDKQVAQEWVNNGNVVLVRTTSTGFGGAGITIIEKGEVPDALFYSKHLRHKREFRVHVFGENIIEATEKLRKKGANVNKFIRSHKNGWIFAQSNIEFPEEIFDVAKKTISALRLNFGAVDITYKNNERKAYVLEVNTAPGVVGRTVMAYGNAIAELL